MLLLEKDMPGIECTQMKCMGVWSSGTTYITFEDVQVPVTHIIGKENEGVELHHGKLLTSPSHLTLTLILKRRFQVHHGQL